MLTHSQSPKAGYLQQAWSWLRFFFIIIVVNVFLVFLVLQFIIIPYLIEAGDLPNVSVPEIFFPTASPSPPQDVDSQTHSVPEIFFPNASSFPPQDLDSQTHSVPEIFFTIPAPSPSQEIDSQRVIYM
jgi:hypothetical protein